MIYKKDAINVERIIYYKPNGKIRSSWLCYSFKCKESDCSNIIISPKRHFKTMSGRCRFCSHKKVPFKNLYNKFKSSVKSNGQRKGRKKHTFNLTFKQFLSFTEIQNCVYCNFPIEWKAHFKDGRARYNLDRKDSNKGYSTENCVVCCKRCNYMKGEHFTYEEFKEVTEILDKIRNRNFKYRKSVNEGEQNASQG